MKFQKANFTMDNFTLKDHKNYLTVINQMFEIEEKLKRIQEQNSIQRNLNRLKDFFATEALPEGQGLVYYNPLGEKYNETRTDCDARISGPNHKNLKIIEVLKPIIYVTNGNSKIVVQKAVVITQSEN